LKPRVFGFSVNTSNVLTGNNQIISPKDNLTPSTPVYNVQGVFRKGSQTWLVASGKSLYENSTTRLIRYNDGDTIGTRYRWPHGSEGLYYDRDTSYLWCLTEFEPAAAADGNTNDARSVFAVRLTDYD
jgi:hypothetical protein